MDIGVISVRYARALLKASVDANSEETVYEEMNTLAHNYISVPELRLTIDNPMLSKQHKAELLVTATGGKPCEITRSLINVVLKEDRVNIMQFIANSYITLYRKHKNIIRAKLSTATEVSSDIKEKMKKIVESRTNGETVDFETQIKPELIGGFVLEYDTYRMDNSIKTKLNTIMTQLSK
ncbi:MAG: F0F1 ATP synthase subunit delta [Prevotella sp.]